MLENCLGFFSTLALLTLSLYQRAILQTRRFEEIVYEFEIQLIHFRYAEICYY